MRCQLTPSHSQVSANGFCDGLLVLLPPNSTSRCRLLSKAIPCSNCAVGIAAGSRRAQVVPSHSQCPLLPTITSRTLAASNAMAADTIGGGSAFATARDHDWPSHSQCAFTGVAPVAEPPH